MSRPQPFGAWVARDERMRILAIGPGKTVGLCPGCMRLDWLPNHAAVSDALGEMLSQIERERHLRRPDDLRPTEFTQEYPA
jgi:hypothetical protein